MTFDAGSFPIVHAVTDSNAVMHESFIDRASAVMRALGPRGAIHLRSSRMSGKEFYELAVLLANFQKATGCWLIVNDRVDVAAAVGAKGVQLASHSMRVSDALKVTNVPVGASVHSVREAVAAETYGASWCVAGTVFETPSHVGRAPARIEFVESVVRAVKIPVVAIGGVTPDDVAELRNAGAHGVATIRGVGWEQGLEASSEEDSQLKTRLPVLADPGFLEPVTRYISAYDSDSGNGQDDHPDGERSGSGAREQ
ncbi:MAG TPA: thiamine phosphate synthase [Gemmatimonadaceae bacterium]